MLITDAEANGHQGLSLRIANGRIEEIGAQLQRRSGEEVRSAQGGSVLPGLHDHHIHLEATAAAARSTDCGPPTIRDEAHLVRALREASARLGEAEELRGVGYHESVAGELDARRLSQWLPDRPLRIQHRTGACWMLNDRALGELDASPDQWPAGTERNAEGQPTGRFFRLDDWLLDQRKAGLRPVSNRPSLADLSRTLASRGVTGFTDASARNDDEATRHFMATIDRGELVQRGVLMGSEALGPIDHPMLVRGALKILLDEPALPDFDELVSKIECAHAGGRAVAMHCVTRSELTFALAAWQEAGCGVGDRIEHASVAPPELVDWVARTPLAVVTQPHFIHERGDAYLRDVDPLDRPWLYRGRAWLQAGVPLAAGSDAPYGEPDPWRAMGAAIQRRTAGDEPLDENECLEPAEALALFASNALQSADSAAGIHAGRAADLILLDRPWREAIETASSDCVVLTLVAGQVVYQRS